MGWRAANHHNHLRLWWLVVKCLSFNVQFFHQFNSFHHCEIARLISHVLERVIPSPYFPYTSATTAIETIGKNNEYFTPPLNTIPFPRICLFPEVLNARYDFIIHILLSVVRYCCRGRQFQSSICSLRSR